jgi:tetratricopeptide (TPR) repeat protein
VEVASGNLAEAEKQLEAALDELRDRPAPLAAWKTYAELGRLKLQLGDSSGAQEAFAQAAEIVNLIAANTAEKELHKMFMDSAPVKEVMSRSAEQ